ncbi:hypothetical protein RMSM_04666 [Rhodopirellula maiorica SM1]|uniref:Uncharacterized protein n=1 Tax=Rhodopirellula maiorica SM1 TaxID=1265738 RepID=M5RGG1_9BACT|nr:hypothetical protein RMSM_04666 [Rhodopirellula maiorica SM1]
MRCRCIALPKIRLRIDFLKTLADAQLTTRDSVVGAATLLPPVILAKKRQNLTLIVPLLVR